MSNGRNLLAAALAVVLAGCAVPMLKEDGYNASKYGLPPVLHPGDSKELTLDENGEAWAFIPAVKGQYYEVSAGGPENGTLSIYHADKTTAYVTAAIVPTARGFIVSATENVFVKLAIAEPQLHAYPVNCLTFPVLARGVWANGSLVDYLVHWYVLPAVGGASYDFRLNIRYNGDGTKSAYAVAQVYQNGRTSNLGYLDSGSYQFPTTYVPTESGILFVGVVTPQDYDSGTFALMYQ